MLSISGICRSIVRPRCWRRTVSRSTVPRLPSGSAMPPNMSYHDLAMSFCYLTLTLSFVLAILLSGRLVVSLLLLNSVARLERALTALGALSCSALTILLLLYGIGAFGLLR